MDTKISSVRKRANTFSGATLFVIAVVAGISSTSCLSVAEGLQTEFRKIADTVIPGVVQIDVVEVVKGNETGNGDRTPFFDYFFDDGSDNDDKEREFRQESLGSGVIVRREGESYFVLTNGHVIADAQDIEITLDDGRSYAGKLVGKDERKDLALVSFETKDKDIAIVRLGDSDELRVGDIVIAVGAPYGYQSTLTSGVVSALHRRGGPAGNINDFIQTDASINKGNSGGALVNLRGEVIGINTWITSQTGGSVGLGFSIPINNIKQAIGDFIATGKIRYGWLGVSISSLDQALADDLGTQTSRGALITGVYDESPARLAGIKAGDVVVGIAGRKIASSDDLIQRVGELPVDGEAVFEVIRGGKTLSLKTKIAQRPEDETLAKNSVNLWPGFSVYPLNDQIRVELEIDDTASAVLIRQITPQSPGQKAGLKSRDMLLALNGTPTPSVRDFYRLLDAIDGSEALILTIKRDGKEQIIEVKRNQ